MQKHDSDNFTSFSEPADNAFNEKLLGDFLDKLAEKPLDIEEFDSFLDTVCRIYDNGYRHQYSLVYKTLEKYLNEDNTTALDTLSGNLNALLKAAQNRKKDIKTCVCSSLQKLTDHTNLEVARYYFYSGKFDPLETLEETRKIKKSLSDQMNAIKESQNQSIETKNKLDSVEKLLKNNIVSSVVILSIFSAIVISFSGGLSLLASGISGTISISSKLMILVVAMIGFVMFNLILILRDIIFKFIPNAPAEKRNLSGINSIYGFFKKNCLIILVEAVLLSVIAYGLYKQYLGPI